MKANIYGVLSLGAILVMVGFAVVYLVGSHLRPGVKAPASIDPAKMAKVGAVSDRFQSYNIGMIDVTGGKSWKPYEQRRRCRTPARSGTGPDTPVGMNAAAYACRPPIDLSNQRLRALAKALGPAYLRVSGTWANMTWLEEPAPPPAEGNQQTPADDREVPSDRSRASTMTPLPAPLSGPPPGFMEELTSDRWKAVIDFAAAVDAKIVTSFATGAGTRDAGGAWTPELASRFLKFTSASGGTIAAAEFMNEPNAAAMGGAPAGYNATNYGRDFKAFRDFARQVAPDMLILGPGSVGETTGDWGLKFGAAGVIGTSELLAAAGPGVDRFSFHTYGAASKRCASMEMPQTTVELALSEGWLARVDQILDFYRALRDQYEPGKPIWVTEIGDSACGGNPWASTFIDTFRYLDQLGRLARKGVEVVMHNSLASGDSGMLEEETFEPRPSYWGALLWHRLMGTTVLDPGLPKDEPLHVYAHCLRDSPGGVGLLVLNTEKSRARTLKIPFRSERYTLSAADLVDGQALLNWNELKLGTDGALPQISGAPSQAGLVTFAPATITFLAVKGAKNDACRR